MTHLLDTALHYARDLGWAVHPVNVKKRPTTAHGRDDATIDEATIRQFFSNGAQIAVATGPESGLFVLDIDIDPEKGIDGYETLAYLEGRYGTLPHTPHQRTGRGGTQYLFKHVAGLKNSTGKLGAGIDTRGEGGYAVVAPSRNTNGPYEWIVSPDDAPLADVPQWLIDLLLADDRPVAQPSANGTDAYARAALAGELSQLAQALPGQRNATLNRAAFSLGQLVGAGALGRAEVEAALSGVAAAIGLDARETTATIRSGLDAGESDPRQIPDRLQNQPNVAGDLEIEPPHPAEAADDPRPAIDISTIDLPAVMPQAWAAIVAQNDPPALFRRAGELARLGMTEGGALIVKTADTRVMLGILARAARWVKVTYTRGVRVEKESLPPAAVVDDAMVNIDPRIPSIARVVSAPTFADADTLLSAPGYHAATRIYYDPKPGAVVPPVPDKPTAADLAQARSLVLDDLLVNFPFVSKADLAHAVALFLLPFVRELIPGPTPLHLIEAPTMGSGKGLLADVLLLPSLGDVPAPMAEATTDEEWRKRITSTLLGAPAVVCIDNLNRTLDAGALAAALTAHEWSDRLLGKSEQIQMPVRCAWVATANNPTLSTEISRRCIRIRIDPRVDKPWQREDFKHPKLRSWVETNRGRLIWAALIICRYGLQHGTAGRPLGSYEAWSDVIGRILHGAGFEDFLGNLDALYDRADTEGAAWRALIATWWAKHQGEPTTAGDLFPLVAEAESDVLISGKDEMGRKKSFGKALARAQDRVFSIDSDDGTLRLQVGDGGVRHKVKLWKLARVERGVLGVLGVSSHPHARDNNSPRVAIEKNPPNTPNPPAMETVDLPANLPDATRPAASERDQKLADAAWDLLGQEQADAARRKAAFISCVELRQRVLDDIEQSAAQWKASVQPWTDGPDQVAVSLSRIRELMDSGLSKVEAQRQAVEEARAAEALAQQAA